MQGSSRVQRRLAPWLLVQLYALLWQGPRTCLMGAERELQGGVLHLPLCLRPITTLSQPLSLAAEASHAHMQVACLDLVMSAG